MPTFVQFCRILHIESSPTRKGCNSASEGSKKEKENDQWVPGWVPMQTNDQYWKITNRQESVLTVLYTLFFKFQYV